LNKKKNYETPDQYCLMGDGEVGREVDDEKRLVVPLEDIFETIYIVHAAKRFHQGINKTLDQLQAK